MDIYAGGASQQSAQQWNVIRLPLFDKNALTPGSAGSSVYHSPTPFQALYINFVQRTCRLYLGEGKQRFIGTLQEGQRRSIMLPSQMTDIYVEWDGNEAPALATFNSLQLPMIELWLSSDVIFYAEAYNNGIRIGDVWTPNFGVPWNGTDFTIPDVPTVSPVMASIPLIMDSQPSGNGGFHPMIDASYDTPRPSLLPGMIPFTMWEGVGVTNQAVRGNQRAFTRSYAVMFTRVLTAAGEPYAIAKPLVANTPSFGATLWSPAGDVFSRLRRMEIAILDVTVAMNLTVWLADITSLPTGGVSMQVSKHRDSILASTMLARSAPSGGAADGGERYGLSYYALGITAGASASNPPVPTPWVTLYDDTVNDGLEPLTIEGGNSGWGILMDGSATGTVHFIARAWFTEHSAV